MLNKQLNELVEERISRFIAERSEELELIADDLLPLAKLCGEFLTGGKRFRAQFCYWGWNAVALFRYNPLDQEQPDLASIVTLASSLEIFHAAALIHDDLIDHSDTRRGRPSLHRSFEELHRSQSWQNSGEDFGHSAALLAGDLLLGWSDQLLDEAIDNLPSHEHRLSVRREFVKMRQEVTLGQYLDILEEQAWASVPEKDLLDRALKVIVYKSAKYSVESPLLLGAALADAESGQFQALSEFGLPLGIAYQLRDDLLGVFGDSAVTGKPSGDDLREGKRTVLIALARQSMPRSSRRLLDELLGDPELSQEQIALLQREIQSSGAVEKVESIIQQQAAQAKTALYESDLAEQSIQELLSLADAVSNRQS